MKRLFALLLASMMLLTLAACGNKEIDVPQNDTPKTDPPTTAPKVKLETFEMTCEPDGAAEPAKVTVGFPKNFTMEKRDWCVTLTDEAKDVAIEVYFTSDFCCYADNEEYAKEDNFHYEAVTFGNYQGYITQTDVESADLEVYIYLGCVAEMDDVYMTFYISSASYDVDADPLALYKLEEVQQVLNSVVYTAPAELPE